MGFKKLEKKQYPPRLWALVGYPGDGKSTFATQMTAPILTIDADHRFIEVSHLAQGDIYQLSDNPDDNNNVDAIAAILDKNMPGATVGTIVIDSLSAIITPLVTKAIRDNDAGVNKNRMAGWKDKALSMRTLQHAVSKWSTDVLWIYHLQDSMDSQANEVVKATLPQTERNRLHSSLNMELHIVTDGERRGVKVVWARRGRDGFILWDDSGTWRDMPARIESGVYDGLTEAEQDKIETEAPPTFPNPEAAIDWGMKSGAFSVLQHCQNAYAKLKNEHNPKTAKAMRNLWIADIERRLKEKQNSMPMPEKDAVQADLIEDGPEHWQREKDAAYS